MYPGSPREEWWGVVGPRRYHRPPEILNGEHQKGDKLNVGVTYGRWA